MKKLFAGLTTMAASFGTFCAFAAEEASEATTAATEETTSGSNTWIVMVVYIALLVALFYFLIIRPQKKRQKEEQERKSSLCLGQKLITIGGIVGTIMNIKDDEITIQTSIDNTLITIKDWAIREVVKLETAEEEK